MNTRSPITDEQRAAGIEEYRRTPGLHSQRLSAAYLAMEALRSPSPIAGVGVEQIERVALAIERADREKGYDYDRLGINHDEISDWGIHLAKAAIEAITKDAVVGQERERSLQAIGDVIAYWLKWVEREHSDEGLPVTPDTHVMLSYEDAPPHWPSLGQLKLWLEVLRGSAPTTQGKVSGGEI